MTRLDEPTGAVATTLNSETAVAAICRPTNVFFAGQSAEIPVL